MGVLVFWCWFCYLVHLIHRIAGKLEHQLGWHDGCRHDAAAGGGGELMEDRDPTPQGGVGRGG